MARVVVAEDDADLRRLVAFTLRRRGHAVLEAADGAAALALIRRERPGLVLPDVPMPARSGLEVLRALAEDAALPPIPVVLLSTSAQLPAGRRAWRPTRPPPSSSRSRRRRC
jgi:CheY-like chemotaxis protein